jgi:predicted nucleic acid-binding protein
LKPSRAASAHTGKATTVVSAKEGAAQFVARPPRLVVVDASFVLRYVLHTQSARPHPRGLQMLDECELLVPTLWHAEVANALVQAERRGAATAERVGQALAAILALEPEVDVQPVDVSLNLELARAHGLSAYDSLYLELAHRRRAALATYDTEMAAAAQRAGIRLYPTFQV